jgi:hypothetical protein
MLIESNIEFSFQVFACVDIDARNSLLFWLLQNCSVSSSSS